MGKHELYSLLSFALSINLFSFLPLGFSAEPMLSTSFSFRHLLSNKYMKTLLICVYTALYRTAQRAFKKKMSNWLFAKINLSLHRDLNTSRPDYFEDSIGQPNNTLNAVALNTKFEKILKRRKGAVACRNSKSNLLYNFFKLLKRKNTFFAIFYF